MGGAVDGADFDEFVQRTRELALIAHLQVVEGPQRCGISQNGDGVAGGVIGIGLRVAGSVAESGAFEVPGAHETPLSDHHLLDEDVLDVGGGGEFELELSEEIVEAGAGFTGEQDGFGEESEAGVEAVLDGVGGGSGFAGRGDGAAGFPAVGARGVALLFGDGGID